MTSHGSGSNRFFDDMSRLMTNAMGVAQGAKSEAETAMKGWVDRWLADRNLVTRDEFEVVREMAIKARTENAELRAMIAAMSGGTGVSAQAETARAGMNGTTAQAANASHVSEAEAPATDMTAPDIGNVGTGETPHVSEAEAPATDMTPPNVGDVGGTGFDEPHVSEAEAPTTDMTPPDVGDVGGASAGTTEAEAPTTDMNPGPKG